MLNIGYPSLVLKKLGTKGKQRFASFDKLRHDLKNLFKHLFLREFFRNWFQFLDHVWGRPTGTVFGFPSGGLSAVVWPQGDTTSIPAFGGGGSVVSWLASR
ncbi:hypothetical protein HKX54_10610 [Sulfitobacter sp. M57]|uniref:hypothetical protein n=1 Tax=unclassified Sulfitobacter TaxID=196795 RepID=UPI0023E2D788|nr:MULTISPECIES: hypothetical protein [unclassified Sulfitobacter]MDF3414905.1 hypothetical protein [Sulfitobacter sp. KE5]MDF3422386.1 hypothetical protein [Sulfitobacter sp. KE43]MDF3433451.1 hypothetical protein [Sulfitobacter sp. KE42]MDF3459091.1 hypothetical protein [Sulfitobacter sp. S74]MDF3462990.1 hypothetical protein [Sulfitobacter sp. Ks18]